MIQTHLLQSQLNYIGHKNYFFRHNLFLSIRGIYCCIIINEWMLQLIDGQKLNRQINHQLEIKDGHLILECVNPNSRKRCVLSALDMDKFYSVMSWITMPETFFLSYPAYRYIFIYFFFYVLYFCILLRYCIYMYVHILINTHIMYVYVHIYTCNIQLSVYLFTKP